ncbi:MAG: hypothetical protein OXC62_06360 [Aestuariivita sp.]|nr:hypothetical protein [Aestuariivita sp.]
MTNRCPLIFLSVAVITVVVYLGAASVLPAQTTTASLSTGRASVDGDGDIRTALSREIARLQSDIDQIERLMRWQEDLTRTARVDRAEALRQRRPMSECHDSALRALCDQLIGLFRPDTPSENQEGKDAP